MTLTARIKKIGVRPAFWMMQVYWFIVRPKTKGVKVFIQNGEEVLLVRHRYGAGLWTLPGGGIEKGESPEQTARREMMEELKIEIGDVLVVGSFQTNGQHKRDTIFVCKTSSKERKVTLDPVEIMDAHWVPIDEAKKEPSVILKKCLEMCLMEREY